MAAKTERERDATRNDHVRHHQCAILGVSVLLLHNECETTNRTCSVHTSAADTYSLCVLDEALVRFLLVEVVKVSLSVGNHCVDVCLVLHG